MTILDNSIQTTLLQLDQAVKHCATKDRHFLYRKVEDIRVRVKQGKSIDQLLAQTVSKIEASQEWVAHRVSVTPNITLNDTLPIYDRIDDIKEIILANQVVVLAGETGSGKTTQIPQLCLACGLGQKGLIGHTQPRRLAARTVGQRIAEEMNVPFGEQVGYKVRFSDETSDKTLIKLMTDGILLSELQQDKFLSKYEVIIIDEAHERSLNIDFLMGYLKRILPSRPDLKLIITSATIDLEKFSAHFNDAPIIEVSGRTYPVEVRYHASFDEEGKAAEEMDLPDAIVNAIDEIETVEIERNWFNGPKDVLVFLSGEKEIRDTALALRKANLKHVEVLPLYARLSNKEQQKIFQSSVQRKIILSTNVAETSLTVPGIRYVIDSGVARVSRYSYRSKLQRLPIEAISKASADQRKGRCGRVAEGLCIRLYAEDDFLLRPDFTEAEILRTNLAHVILQMAAMNLGDIQKFPFVDKPDSRLISDGYKLLYELGAIDEKQRLTQTGRQIAKLPVDPKLARMLVASVKHHALKEVLIIASALSVQDPRERPSDKQPQADEKHRQDFDENSDFIAFHNLWLRFETARQENTQNNLRHYCKKQFLSFMRMREWREVHRQLHLICKDMGYQENTEPASYEQVHVSLLHGLLNNIGFKSDDGDYMGCRNRKFFLFPGSGLFKKKPKWVMSAEIVETSKVYARLNAKIEATWAEPIAQHLLKRQYFEPYWSKKRGEVVAYEQVSLYGLVLIPKRTVSYANLDPVVSREIFIRSALVDQEYQTRAAFFAHNQALRIEIEDLENKSRKRDIIVNDDVIYDFYDALIEAESVGHVTFETWRKRVEKTQPQLLYLSEEKLLKQDVDTQFQDLYPSQIKLGKLTFNLSYKFDPSHPLDGVTIDVPLLALGQINPDQLEWLVPGLLKDKCIAMIRKLPKQIRKNFVPVPDFVDAVLDHVTPYQEELIPALTEQLKRMTGVLVDYDVWESIEIEPLYQFNIKLLDTAGHELAMSRSWYDLHEKYKSDIDGAKQADKVLPKMPKTLKHYPDIALPEVVEYEQAGLKMHAYPAFISKGDNVDVELVDTPEQAHELSRSGLVTFYRLHSATILKLFKKKIPRLNETLLYYGKIGSKEELIDDLIVAGLQRTFIDDKPVPTDSAQFETSYSAHKGELICELEALAEQVHAILKKHHQIQKMMKGKVSFEFAFTLSDIQFQLSHLVYKGFVSATPTQWLKELFRYLQAVEQRIDKFGSHHHKDRFVIDQLRDYWQRYTAKKEQLAKFQRTSLELETFRWWFEEYRVSQFAQQLGTSVSVSEKKLDKAWQELKNLT